MPTSLDRKMLPKVRTLIRKFGRACVIEKVTLTHDTSTNVVTPTSSYTETKCVIESIDFRQLAFKQTEAGAARETLVQEGDVIAYVAGSGLDFAPEAGHRLYFGSLTSGQPTGLVPMQIVSVVGTSTGEQIALYQLLVRGFAQ